MLSLHVDVHAVPDSTCKASLQPISTCRMANVTPRRSALPLQPFYTVQYAIIRISVQGFSQFSAGKLITETKELCRGPNGYSPSNKYLGVTSQSPRGWLSFNFEMKRPGAYISAMGSSWSKNWCGEPIEYIATHSMDVKGGWLNRFPTIGSWY